MGREIPYQNSLAQHIENQLLPGSIVLKNDPRYRQGIPDLLVLYRDRWAALEVKMSASGPYEPNQEWYLETMGKMSYASVIYPEIEEAVLSDLQRAFGVVGAARLT